MKQVSIVTYAQVFSGIGFFVVGCLPLVLLIKRSKSAEKIDLNAAH